MWLLNPPPKVWQARRDELLLLGAGLLVAISLVALAIQSRRRRVAETEAERARQELAHAARLTLVGEISASIAHEITQPLSAILSNAEVAQLLLDAREPNLPDLREIVSEIRHDNLRANRIVSEVRSLLQRREVKFEEVNLNVMAKSVIDLARPEARRRGIELRTEFAAGLSTVVGDPIHLRQLLLSLIVNAMDESMASKPGPRTVEVRTADGKHSFLQLEVVARCGAEEPSASVSPTRQEVVALGASVARAIVESHGGTLSTERLVDAWVCRIAIPAHAASLRPEESLVANR